MNNRRGFHTNLFAAAIAATAIAAFSAPAEAACGGRTGVRYGESAHDIALRCGVPVEALRSANPGLGTSRLRTGTLLKIPQPAPRQTLRGTGSGVSPHEDFIARRDGYKPPEIFQGSNPPAPRTISPLPQREIFGNPALRTAPRNDLLRQNEGYQPPRIYQNN